MAIKGEYTFDGITLSECYGRIERMNVRNKVDTTAMLSLYASPEYAHTEGATSFSMVPISFVYDLTIPETMNAQAYVAAKADPRFAGWSDC